MQTGASLKKLLVKISSDLCCGSAEKECLRKLLKSLVSQVAMQSGLIRPSFAVLLHSQRAKSD